MYAVSRTSLKNGRAHPFAQSHSHGRFLTASRRILSRILLVTVLLLPAAASGSFITSSDLFVAPADVPTAVYTPIVVPYSLSGGSVNLSIADVPGATELLGVHIVPVLNPDPSTADGAYTLSDLAAIDSSNYASFYAFQPNVDYFATTILSNSSTISFNGNADGAYEVDLVTSNGVTISDTFFRVDFGDALGEDPAGGAADATNVDRKVTLPQTALTIISSGDPNDNGYLANATAQIPGAVQANSVQAVVDAIKNYYNTHGMQKFEVTIIGHGRAGSIKIGTQRINDQGDTNGGMTSAAFQAAIDQYVSSVHFFSCSTGAGATGQVFLNNLASSIPLVTAYNNYTTAAQTYFDTAATAQLVQGVPEPAALVSVVCGMPVLALLVLRRRRTGTASAA